MTTSGAQYDQIGDKYNEYADSATLKQAERYSVLQMVGALDGKHVMDLACGLGFYTRLVKQQRAAQVIGVDISPEMIRLAQQQEQAQPLGIDYQVRDAASLPNLGTFDLITAIYLFNYAVSKAQMLAMFHSAYKNLAKDGRLVAYVPNPAFTLSGPNCTPYGVTVLREEPEEDRHACEAEFLTDPPTAFNYYRWNQATYEWAIQESGFQDFTWYPSEVHPEDISRYGEAYWQDFYNNCLIIGLMCQK